MNTKRALIGLVLIIAVIVIIVIVLKILFFGKEVSTDKLEMKKAGSDMALKYAAKDIAREAEAGIVKVNELNCNTSQVIDYEIIIVECTTSNEKIIDYYNSKKIYYAFKKNGEDYKYFISKSKNDAVNGVK